MRRLKIDIGNTSYKNINEISTKDGISPILINGYKNEVGDDIKRPGYSSFIDVSTGQKIDGLFWYANIGKFIVVSNGSVFTVTFNGTVTTIGTGLTIGKRVRFLFDGTQLLMANGADIYYTTGTDVTKVTDAQAPTAVTGLTYLDENVLASSGGDLFYTDSFPAWEAADSVGPDSLPDEIADLGRSTREIFVFGPDMIESYFNAGTEFARRQGSNIDDGIGGSDTVQKVAKKMYYFLNNNKEIVRIEGRTTGILSGAIDKEIQGYTAYTNAVSNWIHIGGKILYLITFPTHDVTWVYDVKLGFWYQWSHWNSSLAQHEAWDINDYAYSPLWNKHFIGSRLTGKVHELKLDNYTDDDNVIRFVRRTGHISHDILQRKQCGEIRIKTRRGLGNSNVTDPKMMMRYRNNGSSTWGNERWKSLGKQGEYEHIVKYKNLGLYYTRQYEFTHTDATPFELINPIEEYLELR